MHVHMYIRTYELLATYLANTSTRLKIVWMESQLCTYIFMYVVAHTCMYVYIP